MEKQYKFDYNAVPQEPGLLLFLDTSELKVLAICESSDLCKKLKIEVYGNNDAMMNLSVQAALHHGVTGITWITYNNMSTAYTKYVKDGYVKLFDPLYKSANRSTKHPAPEDLSLDTKIFLPEHLKAYVELSANQILAAYAEGLH